MHSRARAWRRVTSAHPVIVNLHGGGSIRALALTPLAGGDLLELRSAQYLAVGAEAPIPADGTLIVPVERVDFVQVL